MSSGLIEKRGADPILDCTPVWDTKQSRVCRALFIPESEGGFTVIATRLPGVASQGETVEEATDNIRDAFSAALAAYLESGDPIPWSNQAVEHPHGAFEKWIVVDG